MASGLACVVLGRKRDGPPWWEEIPGERLTRPGWCLGRAHGPFCVSACFFCPRPGKVWAHWQWLAQDSSRRERVVRAAAAATGGRRDEDGRRAGLAAASERAEGRVGCALALSRSRRAAHRLSGRLHLSRPRAQSLHKLRHGPRLGAAACANLRSFSRRLAC